MVIQTATSNSKVLSLKTPTGPEKTCKGWIQEAALRLLHNNLDPEIAERPEDLVVYGGTGKAARNWECLDQIIKLLKDLGNEETLMIQSGKPVGILPSHPAAPRVIISNSMLVPKWATWENFRKLEDQGLTMYGQMTAGSWIYIGSQGIVQGTYETFAEIGARHFNNTLKGKLVVTAGLGGMGGAQPLAVKMNGGVCLVAEVDKSRIKKRISTGYLDVVAGSLSSGIEMALKAKNEGKELTIGVEVNIVDLLQELIKNNVFIDVLTDQTSAHDLLTGYLPQNLTFEEGNALRHSNPDKYIEYAKTTVSTHVQLMLQLKANGSIVFDYGNNIRGQAYENGITNAFDFPGFVPEYIRPLFCEGQGPFRWVALSGDPNDILVTDDAMLRLFPENKKLKRWIDMAHKHIEFQGLPARICWLGYGEREKAGLEFNRLVAEGAVAAPIAIGRDHLDTGSVASPYRETEAMKDGSDAIADWPILNALINTCGGAGWVSIHHGGGVGIGYSIHAGMVVVADGTKDAEDRLKRVLNNDPATGIIRHADAGYETAIWNAKKYGLDVSNRG